MWRWQQVAAWLDKPQRGAELGVKEGRFTSYILDRFPELHMIAVDTWRVKPPLDLQGYETYKGWNFEAIQQEFSNVTQQFANRLTVMVMDTVSAAQLVPNASLDFVFIDAEHTYDAVLADIRSWSSKVKSGGLLCGHDYCHKFPGVKKAVDDSFGHVDIMAGDNDTWAVRVD